MGLAPTGNGETPAETARPQQIGDVGPSCSIHQASPWRMSRPILRLCAMSLQRHHKRAWIHALVKTTSKFLK